MTQWTIDKWQSSGGLKTIREGAPDDLFLACASYEARTSFVVENLSTDYKVKKAVIYINRESYQDKDTNGTRASLEKMQALLQPSCDDVRVARGSWRRSDSQLRALREALVVKNDDLPDEPAITIDTTTFNRDSLLTALALLRTHRPKSRIRVLYTSPVKHGERLTEGFRGVRNVTGFSGIQRPSQPTLLVILSGFEPDRALKLIEEHEPVRVLLGTGDPPVAPDFLERNMSEQQVVLARQDVVPFSFPTTSITGCRDSLEMVLAPYLDNHNIVIAPMSTKLSTLGVLLVAEHHRNIQITYCVPGKYNTADYSTGVARFYVDDLPELHES